MPLSIRSDHAYIPIEKIIRKPKQSASTSWKCNTSGNRHQPTTYGDLCLKQISKLHVKCTCLMASGRQKLSNLQKSFFSRIATPVGPKTKLVKNPNVRQYILVADRYLWNAYGFYKFINYTYYRHKPYAYQFDQYENHNSMTYSNNTFIIKRNAKWKVPFLLGKSVHRWNLELRVPCIGGLTNHEIIIIDSRGSFI